MKRKAVLLGASSSIGEKVLDRLVDSGYEVLATSNSNEAVRREWQARYGQAVSGAALDMGSAQSVAAFVPIMENFGAPDAFINTAGATDHRLCMNFNAELLSQAAMINYLSPALLSSKAASMMAPRSGGYIVHITSVAARRAKIGNAAYGAAKVALERFTASLALEFARFKVRTLCVAPAFVDSPMFSAFAGDRRREIIRDIPLRRILKPEEVAETVMRFIDGGLVTTGTTVNLGNGEAVF